MKADVSRKTFDASKHYAGVVMQQGRVQLDADWNEQLGIQRHRDQTETRDVIGACGAPKHEAGFRVTPTADGHDLVISPGRYYVQGLVCELEGTPVDAAYVSANQATVDSWHVDGASFASNQYVEVSASNVAPIVVRVEAADPVARQLTFSSPGIAGFQNASGLNVRRLSTYLSQPDLPNPPFANQPGPGLPPVLDIPDGAHLLYLDVWSRHLTALDDDLIREKALGGPDTTTRIKTVWQLKLWPKPGAGPPLPDDTDCSAAVDRWGTLTAPPTGRLSSRTQPAPDADNPCILPPGAGYLGLENQLYRVEIHMGGVLGSDPISFKWSRDNGSVVKAIERISNSTDFTVHDTGPDDVLGLANGQWVEQVDDLIHLEGIARDLFQFQIDPVTGSVTLNFPVEEDRHPQLRRWESNGAVDVPWPPINDGWIELENGIQVRFEAGTYETGDYWVIPARTILGDIEWPRDGLGHPVAQLRRGIKHEYCKLGVLHKQGAGINVEDCRLLFPPLNEVKPTSSCCTFTVGDGVVHVGDFTLIQEAVDSLPPSGGQICIFPGTYVENVTIAGRTDVHLKGCGDRTRVVANPPNADGVAAAVLHLVGTEGIKIEALVIEAAETAPGVLADGQRSNRRIVLESVVLKAARNSAIKIRGSEDVTIERCQVEMTDGNGGWPGIFVQATDATIRDSVVLGPLRNMTPHQVFAMKGTLAVSGLQLGGGCEQVRIHDNLFHGCSGQGITLGSMIELGPEGNPLHPDGGRGWVADGNDPCADCDDVTTGDRTGGDRPEEDLPPRLQSEGDLYDIDIRRNRILDTGLDGVGVVHFFDLSRPRNHGGLVRVEDLVIVDNRIERCVRRTFAHIPPTMVDLMAYGGISLSVVEGLIIRDNRIEDVGFGGLLPVCGIFAVYAEGAEFGRNRILNSWSLPPDRNASDATGREGGIHVVFCRALQASVSISSEEPVFRASAIAIARDVPTMRGLEMAAIVEENTVDVSLGQALSLGALGPVSVVSNRLMSRGLARRTPAFSVRQGASSGLANPLAGLSSLVTIANLGSSPADSGPVNLANGMSGVTTHRLITSIRVDTGSDSVLFDDNVCLLDLGRRASRPERAAAGNLLPPAILILSLGDVGVQDNRCECNIHDGFMPSATVLVGLASERVISNRFKETLGKVLFSSVTFGRMNITAHNQANHCLKVMGTTLVHDGVNQVLIDVLQKEFCVSANSKLMATLKALVG